jgi:hypothetical protein
MVSVVLENACTEQSVVFYFDLIKIWQTSMACYKCLICINDYLTLLFSCVISGFRRDVNENGALLGYIPEDGTNRLFRSVGKKLPLFAA